MIDLFVFDLGQVILPFEHRPIASKLWEKSRKRSVLSPNIVFDDLFDLHNGSVNNYEEGLVSSEEFFLDVRKRYDLDMSFDDFKDVWNNIFWDDPKINEIILYLKGKGYPVFLLSNTNELHFQHIIEQFPIVHQMNEWILSFEVGAKKPKKRIYDAIFERADVKAEHVFYVDDIDAYVAAACSHGIRGLVYTNPDDLWKTLRELNV
jgi:putative hydrolase of the HAD superfamily